MGQWIARARKWFEIDVINCRLCGKMLPGRFWRAEVKSLPPDTGGCTLYDFCDPGCEEMYHRYWEPRYGGREVEPHGKRV